MVNRVDLQTITYLSAAGFGAKLLGVFANGMVQSYLVARTLEPCGMTFSVPYDIQCVHFEEQFVSLSILNVFMSFCYEQHC